MRRNRRPLPSGTRVHHRGCMWSYGFTEAERQARPSWGWGTVLQAVPQRDGTVEYEVQRDAPHAPDMPNGPTWWASYHIDDHEPRSSAAEASTTFASDTANRTEQEGSA